MATLKCTGRAALITALLGSTAAHADVTAQQVWDDWTAQMDMYGEVTLTTDGESMDGGTMTIETVTLSSVNDEMELTFELGPISLAENGDGTVTVSVPESMPMTVVTSPTYGDPVTVEGTIGMSNYAMDVSGDPGALNYEMSADSVTASVDSIEGEDEVMLEEISLAFNGLQAATTSTDGDVRHMESSMTVQEVLATFNISENGGPGILTFSGSIDGLATQSVVDMPADIDPEAPETVFVDGLSVDAGYSYGATEYSFEFAERSDNTSGSASASGGELFISMGIDGISFSGGASDPQVSFEGSDVPFPIDISLDEYSYGLELPLGQSDEPTPFGLNLLISNLAVNDMVWGMVDPGGALPHDPATVNLDLSGEVQLDYDLLDPANSMELMSGALPGDILSLNLDDLTIQLVGAEVLGNGAFTFDNEDLATFNGIPRPMGELNLQVNGANALIDTLVDMGLLPQEQVMGARMMLGMFATPTGEDQLESTLEINEQGHVIANGQRIQ
ncbi:DUF2125 domain-containing protein [Pelagovum pacificum]|uniref:DUF2125 domain-containing protein n=1 Tax=Pelagovum pacificum TaxID=2588711 RepID=A0A5C5GGB1_9RHOB|nr:DUF2125 domain-containing protein [Pelagovum pacificum]QQA43068.1 DUF2125 domain-containing protein [Pelagovum pacificum]TNY33788.1 DUF2125 domain-containing protein [Pelagovum pacificum]